MADTPVDQAGIYEVQPGELAAISCPDGSAPKLADGALVNDAAGAPAAVVVRTEDTKVWVGPLRSGEATLAFDCAGTTANFKIRTMAVDPQSLPPPAPALPPFSFSWLGYVLAAVFAIALIAGWVTMFLMWRRRKRVPPKPPVIPKTPREKFTAYLADAAKGASVDDPAAVKRLYSEGYELVRASLESSLKFAVPEATTKEFVGELKGAVHRWNGTHTDPTRKRFDAALVGTVESLLLQSDQVRFAGETPAADLRQAFVKNLQKVEGALP